MTATAVDNISVRPTPNPRYQNIQHGADQNAKLVSDPTKKYFPFIQITANQID